MWSLVRQLQILHWFILRFVSIQTNSATTDKAFQWHLSRILMAFCDPIILAIRPRKDQRPPRGINLSHSNRLYIHEKDSEKMWLYSSATLKLVTFKSPSGVLQWPVVLWITIDKPQRLSQMDGTLLRRPCSVNQSISSFLLSLPFQY